MSFEAPFAGLKVVDLSQGVAGPYTGMLMAQYGADVIKVEPHEGDWGRTISACHAGHSAYSLPSNLGKRSVVVDLKTEEGRKIVFRLLEDADVFIEGFRPGVAARLGVGYDAVSAANPGVLYLSISGFGQTGPLAGRPAMDPVLQAFSGMMSVNKGMDGIPHRVGFIVCDMSTALYAFQALAVSLYARRDSGEGRYIEANLMQGIGCLQVVRLILNQLDGGTMAPGRVPSGTFPTADGWVNVLIFKEEEFPAFCDIIGRPDLAADPRFETNAKRIENEAALVPQINEACAKIDGATFSEKLTEARILHERVNDFFDFLKHPQVEETGLITWLEHPGMGEVPVPNAPGLPKLVPGDARAALPGLGEHTREVLKAHGYGDRDIDALIARRILADGGSGS